MAENQSESSNFVCLGIKNVKRTFLLPIYVCFYPALVFMDLSCQGSGPTRKSGNYHGILLYCQENQGIL